MGEVRLYKDERHAGFQMGKDKGRRGEVRLHKITFVFLTGSRKSVNRLNHPQ